MVFLLTRPPIIRYLMGTYIGVYSLRDKCCCSRKPLLLLLLFILFAQIRAAIIYTSCYRILKYHIIYYYEIESARRWSPEDRGRRRPINFSGLKARLPSPRQLRLLQCPLNSLPRSCHLYVIIDIQVYENIGIPAVALQYIYVRNDRKRRLVDRLDVETGTYIL